MYTVLVIFLSLSLIIKKKIFYIFQCEKTLFAHPGGVTCISVHPTGKLALSVGNDKKLCTWNLIKGRRAYVTHVGVGMYLEALSCSCMFPLLLFYFLENIFIVIGIL